MARSILAIALLALALTLGYTAFLTRRDPTPVWDLMCIAATLAFLGVLVRIVALRIERMIDEEGAEPDPFSREPAPLSTRTSPEQNMSADSPPGHRGLPPVAEYHCEESV